MSNCDGAADPVQSPGGRGLHPRFRVMVSTECEREKHRALFG
jgi:hypothetical protein